MQKVETVSALRSAVSTARSAGKRIGFVPTMGNLHAGHLQLLKTAQRQSDFTVVSIYVNPTQFGANEDLDTYPSTPEEDARALAELGADLLFSPDHEQMYPGGIVDQTVVSVPKMGEYYCGADRPGHFDGVTTVVSRLFNMVQPDVAVFGKKDYQQLAILRKMVEDLAFPVEIVGVDTVRSESGLALSSRNGYLNTEQLQTAATLQATLQWAGQALQKSNCSTEQMRTLEHQASQRLVEAGFEPHYLTVCRRSDLQPAAETDNELVILAAAVLGQTRLIDNLEVTL